MKKILLLISSLVIATSLFAKDLIDGYIIKANSDTVKCKIKVPKAVDLFDKVSIVDSSGKTTTYRARNQEIKEFGFNYKGEQYTFVLKTNKDSIRSFLQVLSRGKKFNLYYSFSSSGGYQGGASYRIDSYLLEDMKMITVSVSGGLFSAYKKKITRFLKDDPDMLNLFDKTVLFITDIPNFVKQANQ